MIKDLIPASKTVRCLLVAAVGVLSLVLVLAWTGLFGPMEYGTADRRITVEAGDESPSRSRARPSLGEHWYLADRPDAGVLDYSGTHEDTEGADEDVVGGGDGTAYFDFTARARGTTTVTLLRCPMARCGSVAEARAIAAPVPTADVTDEPDDRPAFFRCEITVR